MAPLYWVERDENGPVANWNQVTGQVKVGVRVGQLEQPFLERSKGWRNRRSSCMLRSEHRMFVISVQSTGGILWLRLQRVPGSNNAVPQVATEALSFRQGAVRWVRDLDGAASFTRRERDRGARHESMLGEIEAACLRERWKGGTQAGS